MKASTGALEAACSLIRAIDSEEGVLNVEPDGFWMRVAHPSNVAIFRLKSSGIEGGEPHRIGVKAAALQQALKGLPAEVDLAIDGSRLTFKAAGKVRRIACPDVRYVNEPKDFDFMPPASCRALRADLLASINACTAVRDQLNMALGEGGLTISSESEKGDLAQDTFPVGDRVGEGRVYFKSDLTISFLRAISATEVKLSLGDKVPFRIDAPLPDGSITYIQAPLVEVD